MKKIGAWRFALVYAGCFLGAGYLSGQELWQFFGVFGRGGLWGLALCAVLQICFCRVLISLTRRGNIRRIDHVAVRRERRRLRALVGGAQMVLLIGVMVIMSAGVGALTAQMLGGGKAAASLLLCAAVALVSLRGVRGLVTVFSCAVPALIAAAIGMAAWTALRRQVDWGRALASAPSVAENPLLTHWTVAAVLFVSYNLFGSVAVLLPIAQEVASARSARRGAVIASCMLLPVAVAILYSMLAVPEVTEQELPMLALAQHLHPAAGAGFAVLLVIAMFGTSLSCMVAVQEYLCQQFSACKRHPLRFAAALSALIFLAGLFGFGSLIGWIYPLFGYLGIAFLLAMTAHERFVRRAERQKNKEKL